MQIEEGPTDQSSPDDVARAQMPQTISEGLMDQVESKLLRFWDIPVTAPPSKCPSPVHSPAAPPEPEVTPVPVAANRPALQASAVVADPVKIAPLPPRRSSRIAAARSPVDVPSTIAEADGDVSDPTDGQSPATAPVRRSKRIRDRSTQLVTTVLLLWMSLVRPSASLFIQSLPPGLHAKALRNVTVSTFDLNFNVKSNLNTTHDSEVLNQNVQEFQAFCDSLNQTNTRNISNYCHPLSASLGLETQLAVKYLTSRQRSSRALPAVVAPILATVGKSLPHLVPHMLTAGYMIYQEVQIAGLQSQLETVRDRTQKVAILLTNATDIESEAVATELNELIQHQRLQQLHGEMAEYAESLQAAIQETLLRYDNVTNLRPYDALVDYVKEHQEMLGSLRLPPHSTTSEIFTYEPAKISVDHDIVHVSFVVPLILSTTFTEYELISAPDHEGHAIVLEDYNWHQMLVFDEANATFFAPLIPAPTDKPVYRRQYPRPAPLCLRQIMSWPPTADSLRSCESKVFENMTELFSLGEEWAVVLTDDPTKIQKNCQSTDNETLPHLTAGTSLVLFTNCQISSDSVGLTAAVHVETSAEIDGETKAIPTIPTQLIKSFQVDPRIKALRDEITRTLREPLPTTTFGSVFEQHFTTIAGVSTFVLILIFSFTLSRYGLRRLSRRISTTDDPSDIPLQDVKWADVWTAWKASASTAPAPTV